jgi:predicted metal-dependent hydrolase
MTMPPNHAVFNKGVRLFNRAHFFDAHEALEDVWRALPRDRPPRRPLRLHVQGMVQLAVAFHHESTGNHIGARSVLERALRNLKGADRSFPDLDFDRLRADLAEWQKHLAGAAPRPKPPHVAKRKPAP